MVFRLLGLAAFMALSVSAQTQGLAKAPQADFPALDAYFNTQLAKKQSPSISVAVVKNGKLVYAKGFGYADLENDVLAAPNSVYRIGSITKQFTATMIMQLEHEGKLKLDQGIRTLLPETPTAWDKVTVRELLNHTSGIKSYTEVKGLFDDQAMKPTTPAGILKTVEKDPLDFPPGSNWHYDNTGYEILGMVVEKLDGQPFSQSLRKRIFVPLGMTSTFFTSESTVVKHRAQGYSPDSGGFSHAHYLNMDWPYAAGSIESTTLDLAKWDAALYGNKILPQSSLKMMWTRTVLVDGIKKDYGFGWQLDRLNRIEIVQHGGGIHGFTTHIRRAPALGLTLIVLTNSDTNNPEQMTADAMGIVDSRLKVAPPTAILDTNPSATEADRNTLKSILLGKLDRTKLTPEFNKLLTPELEQGAKAQLSAMGPIKRFDLQADETKAGVRTRTYLVTLGSIVLKMQIAVNAKGLIAGLDLHP